MSMPRFFGKSAQGQSFGFVFWALFMASSFHPKMEITDTFEGTQISIKAQGGARFLGAGFLGIWLCGWLIGEVVALSFLFVIGWYLLTGEHLMEKVQLPQGPALYAIGGFLLLWGTLWTLGGIAALREFARLLWGREKVLLTPDRVRVVHRAFPYSTQNEASVGDMQGFSQGGRKRKGLYLELRKGSLHLTRLGTEQEKLELERLIRSRYTSIFGTPSTPRHRNDNQDKPEGRLLRDWILEPLPEGSKAVMLDPAVRRKQQIALWIAAGLFDSLASLLVYKCIANLALAPIACMVSAAGVACTVGAVRMGTGRPEWLLGRGTLTLQRRSASGVRRLFEAVRVELDITHGERSSSAQLYAVCAEARALPPYQAAHRKTIVSKATGIKELRAFGHYLAKQTGMEFIDRSRPENRAQELQALKERLEQGGTFSRWVAGKIKAPEKQTSEDSLQD